MDRRRRQEALPDSARGAVVVQASCWWVSQEVFAEPIPHEFAESEETEMDNLTILEELTCGSA